MGDARPKSVMNLISPDGVRKIIFIILGEGSTTIGSLIVGERGY